MKHRYLVTYDVSDPRRLRKVFRAMKGFGEPVQYSVFRCDLTDVQKMKLKEALVRLIHHTEDRVMIMDLGPAEGRAAWAFDYLGRQEPGAPLKTEALIV
jgi:CRISPR-associated protein Cas2